MIRSAQRIDDSLLSADRILHRRRVQCIARNDSHSRPEGAQFGSVPNKNSDLMAQF